MTELANDPLAPYIRSYIPGRIRIRHPALKSEAAEAAVRGFLEKMEGVTGLELNRRVGSLLLTWDPAKLDIEQLRAMALFCLPAEKKEEKKECLLASLSPLRGAKAVNRMVNRSMTVSYLLLLASLVPGIRAGRAIHTAAGIAFTAALAWHMTRYRKTVF